MYNILCFCLTHWSTSVTAGNPKFYRYGLPHPTTSCWEMACFTFAPNILVNCHPMDRDNSVRKPLNTESNYNSNFSAFYSMLHFLLGKGVTSQTTSSHFTMQESHLQGWRLCNNIG